jgi:hypothetical protein
VLRRKHHGHIDVTGQVSQPLGVTRIWKTGKMEGVFVRGCGNDGVDFAAEGELYRRFDGVARDAARADQPLAVPVRVAAAQLPGPDGDSPLSWYPGDLIFRADYRDLCLEWLSQCAGRDLWSDASGVAQRYSQTWPWVVRVLPSRLSRPSRPSRQDRIST